MSRRNWIASSTPRRRRGPSWRRLGDGTNWPRALMVFRSTGLRISHTGGQAIEEREEFCEKRPGAAGSSAINKHSGLDKCRLYSSF
jgi:hypothetical protein